MKHMTKLLSNNPYKKQLLPLVILCIFSIAIWYGGPFVIIAHGAALAQPEKRFYVILLLFLAWFLKIAFLDAKPQPAKNPYIPHSSELTKKLQALEGRFQGAIRFLKKTAISKQGKNVNLYHLPWYLIIGPTNSGKTTLLANANINFILAKQFKNETLKAIPPSDVCDWWVTRDLVLLDVPGSYINPKLKNAANTANQTEQQAIPRKKLWQSFLDLLKKYRGKDAITGIIITLSLPELITQQQDKAILELKQCITELRTSFGNHLPFYLTITKCDQLPGFLDFFSDCGSDELAQAWGVTLPPLKENEQLQDVFTNRFNALIKRLNKQLIWRLHQARNPLTRPYIKDFPLQIERVKESILALLKVLTTTDATFPLQGVYLTSAIQHATEEPQATQLHAASMSPHLQQIICNPIMPSRSYFARQLLLQGLLHAPDNHAELPKPSHHWLFSPTAYALYLGAAIMVAGFFGIYFRHATAPLGNLAHSQINAPEENQQSHTLTNALPAPNPLSQTIVSESQTQLSSSQTEDKSNAVSEQIAPATTALLSDVKNTLEKYLQTNNSKNPAGLYIALKAYLMLGDKQHLQPDFIIDTIKQITPDLLRNQNASHIRSAFDSTWQPVTLNSSLIASTRLQLSGLPPTDLSYAILKAIAANNTDTAINLGTNLGNPPVLVSNAMSNQIPKMFTADAFPIIFNQQISAAAAEVTQNSWVLGNIAATSTQPGSPSLTDQLRNLYIAHYVDVWESLLDNIKIYTPSSLAQADAMIASLIDNNSPVLQLLKTIKQNTAFGPITAASPKLAALNDLLTNTAVKEDPLYKTLNTLRQIHTDLQHILTASNVGDAALQSAMLRMKNLSATQSNHASDDAINQLYTMTDKTPEPVKSWLNNIATQSWHYTLQEASHAVENHWQTDVLATYHAELADRFPFTPEATKEVSLNQFSAFLGTKGTLANFYQNFLFSFVDSTDKKWQWKKINNDQMPFSDAVLTQLQNTLQLQRVFFPNEDNKLSVRFALQPVALESNIKRVQLDINGQSIQFDHSLPPIPQILTWPGDKNMHATTLQLTTTDSQPVNNNIPGDWGWFRFVNIATTQMINQKELLIKFDLNGHKAKYLLFTQSALNPFLTVNLRQLKLPEQLRENKA